MKLAEALILRADIQKRLEQIKGRISNNLIVQEGTKPSEDPKELIGEFMRLQEELKEFIQRINKTNQAARFDEARTLADVITEREMLLDKRNFLARIGKESSANQIRYSNSELRNIPCVDVSEIQKQADRLSKEYRELDIRLQQKNWTTELL